MASSASDIDVVRQTSGGDDDGMAEIVRMDSEEFAQKAEEFRRQCEAAGNVGTVSQSTNKGMLVNNIIEGSGSKSDSKGLKKKKGAFSGVFVPTCENMWGVLIFLRFHFIVSEAGVLQALCAVVLSFCCAFCTTSSMCATVSSGGIVSKGGPYYMISRALGPVIGVSTGIVYWLAFTFLAVLETLGAVEGILMAAPEARFKLCEQVYGTVIMIFLCLMVWGGINFVSKMGVFFVFIVFFTLFIYYYGLISSPLSDEAKANPWVTGMDFETFKTNWPSHYNDGVNFGTVLSVFFPCFTGILSGANRADILKDPPKNLRHGTFGAIIFSLFVYSSYMILWGSVADYRYLQGQTYHADGESSSSHRRLAGGTTGAHVVTEIVWNPFPHAAHVGIVISSLSQALQCLVVAPKLLQAIAKDEILNVLSPLAPLSSSGEPVRALLATYLVGAALVLMGQLDLVAPLLSMCFLTAYMFMNLSCFLLTLLKSTAWRPKGIQKKRWRLWYLFTSGPGSLICVAIMLTINVWWALAAFAISASLYLYINWKMEQKGWGSAMDGIRFQLALTSLIQLEGSQQQAVNWRPHTLILYKVHLADELKGIKHHEILKFYSHLRKSRGFCVVACVLEADQTDDRSIHKAKIEKGIIQSIMKEERIEGFAEVVVAPSWTEGTNYIIQLTGIGGLTPNTVMLDWPEQWRKHPKKAKDFIQIVSAALAADKSVMAVKGLKHMPQESVFGTLDVWWMIHDGGFLILLSWLLVQHRVWRNCHLRVFTVAENVDAEKATAVGQLLTKTLKQRGLLDVDVEVILVEGEMIGPYTCDDFQRGEDRKKFLSKLYPSESPTVVHRRESIPLEINDLFRLEADLQAQRAGSKGSSGKERKQQEEDMEYQGSVRVSDMRTRSKSCDSPMKDGPKCVREEKPSPAEMLGPIREPDFDDDVPGEHADARKPGRHMPAETQDTSKTEQIDTCSKAATASEATPDAVSESWKNLAEIISSRSKRAQLVVMNLPDQKGKEDEQVWKFMTYCETLTQGLERVLFVHSTGHEVFDISH